MKKETFNLVVRFLVGLALSLLICAGMIAGEGLVGILLAVFAVFGISTALSIDLGNIGGVVLMIVMIACLLAFSMKKKKN